MATAEELLAAAHEHAVTDTDTHFIIDPVSRKIESPIREPLTIMQHDHNSSRYTFGLPRYIDGHDMSLCTSVVVNFDNIEDAENGATNSGFSDIDDLRVSPDNPDEVICSWLISRAATQLVGTLNFSIEYKCINDAGEVVYELGTDTFVDVIVKKRNKNSNNVVGEHVDVLEQWRTKIFGAADSIMANITAEGEARVAAINAEGTEQVTAVKMESEAQQEAVELKGTQTLETIPEDYTETNNMADKAVRTKSDAIVCEAEGEGITLTNSSDDYIRGLKIFGKSSQVSTNGYQLFDASKMKSVPTDSSGVTISNNGDGSFTISGSGDLASGVGTYTDYTHEETISLLKSGALNFNIETTTYPYLYISLRTSSGVQAEITNITNTVIQRTITDEMLSDETLYLRIGFWGAADKKIIPGTIKPMLYQDGDGTWEPYTGGIAAPNPDYPQEIESARPTVNIYGKNLVDNTTVMNVINCTAAINGNKCVLTTTRQAYINAYFACGAYEMFVGRTVTLRLKNSFSSNMVVRIGNIVNDTMPDDSHISGMTVSAGQIGCITVMVPEKADAGLFGIRILVSGAALEVGTEIVIEDVQIELGDTATEYEPYKPVQPLAITQPLPGIPVLTNGNYTDVDGQQWVCDEIDLERGIYVQRIRTIVLTGKETVVNSLGDYAIPIIPAAYDSAARIQCVCSHYPARCRDEIGFIVKEANSLGVSANFNHIRFADTLHYPTVDIAGFKQSLTDKYAAGDPVKVCYILATPIETPLSAEEITAFKVLRTNYPNTTILNDAGAWMSVTYNADTKTYVENPKTLKLVDSSTGVVYELKIVDGNLTVVPI